MIHSHTAELVAQYSHSISQSKQYEYNTPGKLTGVRGPRFHF